MYFTCGQRPFFFTHYGFGRSLRGLNGGHACLKGLWLHTAAKSTCCVFDCHCNTHARPQKVLIAATQPVRSVQFPSHLLPFVQCFGLAADIFWFHCWHFLSLWIYDRLISFRDASSWLLCFLWARAMPKTNFSWKGGEQRSLWMKS